ncbi:MULTISPECIES: DUF2799 domain-containing protein [unclassified Moraxella]|uniref:DUF2799 domain-containing protein n=1 Tax=unclassified Moraxella TaxID=2685852 RepID=UPI003AF4ECE1
MSLANYLKIVALTSLSVGVMSGCATMSKQECQVADWQAVGYKDGKIGQDWDYLQNHAKACGKIAIIPDREKWESGRQQGLKEYCTPAVAYNIGTWGKTPSAVCPNEIRPAMAEANRLGQQVYQLDEQRKKDLAERDKLQNQLTKLQKGENLDFQTEREARAYMLALPVKIQALNQKISNADNRLSQLRANRPL